MRKIRGGMEFATGRMPRIRVPPPRIPVGPLRIGVVDRPEVQAGQTVKPGQLLTDPRGGRGCYVSPVDGVIERIEVRDTADDHDAAARPDHIEASPGYRFPAPGDWIHRRSNYVIHIKPHEEDAAATFPCAPPEGMQLSNWLPLIRKLGPWADRDGGVGLLPQLAAARKHPIDLVIVNGMDPYPPYPVSSSLLRCFAEEVMVGARIIAELVGAAHVHCAVNKAGGITSDLRRPAKKHSVQLHLATNTYPFSDPTVLARAMPGRRRIAPRTNPAFAGLIMLDPWTAARIGRWAVAEHVDLARPMVITWPIPNAKPTVVWSFPGMPLLDLRPALRTAYEEKRLVVLGHPMGGRPIEPLDADDGAQSAMVPDDELLITCMGPEALQDPPAEPCISCGWCATVCPTALRPAHLFDMCNRPGNVDIVLDQLNWCIDCGLCSHICPSSLPLAQTFRQVTYRYEPL